MDAAAFWDGTPLEHGLYLDGVSLARRDALDALTVSAWQTVAFDRTKRLPDLARLLDRRAAREEAEADRAPGETLEQIRAKWRHFFERARAARGA